MFSFLSIFFSIYQYATCRCCCCTQCGTQREPRQQNTWSLLGLAPFVGEEETVHDTGISLLLSKNRCFESPNRRLNVPVHGRRRSPKVQPSIRPGIKPGTFWLTVSDLTKFANLAAGYIIVNHKRVCLHPTLFERQNCFV